MHLHPSILNGKNAEIQTILPLVPFGKPIIFTPHTDGYISVTKLSKSQMTFMAHNGPKNKKVCREIIGLFNTSQTEMFSLGKDGHLKHWEI